MAITIFTHRETAADFVRAMAALGAGERDYRLYEGYDDFIAAFSQQQAAAVIVARRGADGMESARNARLIRPDVPLVWLSDDPGFGVESYRIGCAYFSAEAVTAQLLAAALARCEKMEKSVRKELKKNGSCV